MVVGPENVTFEVTIWPPDRVTEPGLNDIVRGGVAGTTVPADKVIEPVNPFKLERVAVVEPEEPKTK